MARWLDSPRFFHGNQASAERSIRAWALLHDFGPYCPRAKISQNQKISMTFALPFMGRLPFFVGEYLDNILPGIYYSFQKMLFVDRRFY